MGDNLSHSYGIYDIVLDILDPTYLCIKRRLLILCGYISVWKWNKGELCVKSKQLDG